MFCKKGSLRTFTKFTVKHLCHNLFFNKVAHLRPATLSKKRLWHRCFPVTFVKFLKTPFFIEHLWWLLPTLLVPVTSDANLRIFQYKLFRNIGYFNSIFFKFGKVISSFCSIRMQGPETIIHLFHTCTEMNILWYQLRLSL